MIMSVFSSRAASIVLVALLFSALLAAAGLGGWRAASILQAMIEDRVEAAETARDAHWQSAIDAANAAAAQNIIAQLRASVAADLAAREEIQRLKSEVSQLETQNEELPDSDGSGIGADRSRLLNQPYYGTKAGGAH
ncbi:hypothetical protein BG46_01365 [Brucella anthropi]|uniref:hypothetical protein n=1 Tax=Brucella anthropi TaxID=529 RepID=UPI00044A1DB3|nr:hypothetical protein [Brucella anthropi]EXL08205.1 hypothetical protein BG46_01365 [Brucella anthropi]